jgi:hypothetical protein
VSEHSGVKDIQCMSLSGVTPLCSLTSVKYPDFVHFHPLRDRPNAHSLHCVVSRVKQHSISVTLTSHTIHSIKMLAAVLAGTNNIQ